MRRNPFWKYLGPEDRMQNSVMNFIRAHYPKALVTHATNEGKRTPFERYKLKYLGATAGIPDVLVFTPNAKYNGLAIELKYKYNKPTKAQEVWLKELKMCGWYAVVSNDIDKTIDVIRKYFKDEL
ncbi:MAG: hypothetical protein Unbinned2716contig1001_17 [Prokaryotic dsDNA virus sp.]|nr:MAG: hypothetical protein Unbinned2716contig1001_17 [Prokaryotic dsDNA virus sp.]|tara:strand:- start:217 stop:591 length:375 start_codon:yes stop_codon:yes gene_type:complete